MRDKIHLHDQPPRGTLLRAMRYERAVVYQELGHRKRLGLKPGSQFVVVGNKDVVILKAISPPSMKEFDDLIAEARRQAKRARMKRSDLTAAVSKV